MDVPKVVKSDQEQAVATWVDYLNQVRFADLANELEVQDGNLEEAIASLRDAMDTIKLEVIEANRGGEKGIHGFIAEVAEVGIGNARGAVRGVSEGWRWINDNSFDDIGKGDCLFQMKFVKSGGSFSLDACAAHLEKHPDYLDAGKKYLIPKDFYEKVQTLHEMDAETAARLTRGEDGLSFSQWKRVHDFFEREAIGMDDLEPALLEYDDVQQGSISRTMQREEAAIRYEDKRVRDDIAEICGPSLGEAARVAVASAAIEGVASFVLSVAGRMRSGKALRDFSEEDWADAAKEAGSGILKGGVRGVSIYALTNLTATPAAVASSLCTASFGVVEQAHELRSGRIGEVEFVRNAEIVCLDAAVSALSSAIGQAVIPLPVLGAVVGNTVGMVACQIAKESLSSYEHGILEEYAQRQRLLDESLGMDYAMLLISLHGEMERYVALIQQAFHPDPQIAFAGSIALAKALGLPREDSLDSLHKLDAYFLD